MVSAGRRTLGMRSTCHVRENLPLPEVRQGSVRKAVDRLLLHDVDWLVLRLDEMWTDQGLVPPREIMDVILNYFNVIWLCRNKRRFADTSIHFITTLSIIISGVSSIR
ncbi:hypothetical protein TSUD_127350 [Trifolium subterraneum]|nr:hypothetical protein TSUD_127350 [Trifolium subterraneum]